jgi:hypothetical protein
LRLFWVFLTKLLNTSLASVREVDLGTPLIHAMNWNENPRPIDDIFSRDHFTPYEIGKLLLDPGKRSQVCR